MRGVMGQQNSCKTLLGCMRCTPDDNIIKLLYFLLILRWLQLILPQVHPLVQHVEPKYYAEAGCIVGKVRDHKKFPSLLTRFLTLHHVQHLLNFHRPFTMRAYLSRPCISSYTFVAITNIHGSKYV